MANEIQPTNKQFPKKPSTMIDKNYPSILSKTDSTNSLIFWMELYFKNEVFGSKDKTVQAKKKDIKLFFSFFFDFVGTDNIDLWTVSISKEFQKQLMTTPSEKTKAPYKTTTINRVMATLKHWARWIEIQRPFLAGYPFLNVKDLMEDEPVWNGLTNKQIILLKMACDHRLKLCTRNDQNPFLEVAIFYTLLHTGLREFELCSLDVRQYFDKGLHDIKRKGRMVTKRTFLPTEAREKIELYLKDRKDESPDTPLFISRFGNRLKPLDVYRICSRLANQACTHLPETERFKLKPHQIRHTFLKHANDKYGLSYAKKVSGNIGIRELYRYTAPSQSEVEEKIESLYE